MDAILVITDESVWLDSVTQHHGIRTLKGADAIALTLVNQDLVVQAISTNSVGTTDGNDFTWTFSNVQINPRDVLYFVYTATNNTNIVVGETLTAKNGHGVWEVGNQHDMIGAGSTKNVNYASSSYTGNGVLGSNTGSNINLNESFMPVLTIETSKIASIPEPTTATLSLLALAGLAARRRRK